MKLLLMTFLCFALTSPVMAELNPLLKSMKYQDETVKVLRVLTPDTILIEGEEKVKLIGLSGSRPLPRAKEERDEYGFVIEKSVDPATPAEENAFFYVQRLLEGKKVRLEFDAQKKNEQRILEAYVFLENGDLANVLILQQGAAHLKITPPNIKYAPDLRKAYQQARREMKGLQGQW